MKVSFEKPPLVEIVAELRWGIPAPNLDPGALIQINAAPVSPADEEFFARFLTEVGAKGFVMAERLVPNGFPAIAFQPVYRFRKSMSSAGQPVYQLGTNVFSAHITPPYQSWEQFEPALESGIDVLLQTRIDEQKQHDFSAASLRYINAFGEDLTGDMPTAQFMSEILGIVISLPTALDSILKPKTAIEPNIRLVFSTTDGYQVILLLQKGFLNQKKAVIMDTTVWWFDPITAKRDALTTAIAGAQKILHKSFVEMTSKIHNLMKPRGGQV